MPMGMSMNKRKKDLILFGSIQWCYLKATQNAPGFSFIDSVGLCSFFWELFKYLVVFSIRNTGFVKATQTFLSYTHS